MPRLLVHAPMLVPLCALACNSPSSPFGVEATPFDAAPNVSEISPQLPCFPGNRPRLRRRNPVIEKARQALQVASDDPRAREVARLRYNAEVTRRMEEAARRAEMDAVRAEAEAA